MKKKILIIGCLLFTICLNLAVFRFVDLGTVSGKIAQLYIELTADASDSFQVYYADSEFSEEQSSVAQYSVEGQTQKLTFDADLENDLLRLDFGTSPKTVKICSMTYGMFSKKHNLDLAIFEKALVTNDIISIDYTDDSVMIKTQGEDPYIVLASNGGAFLEGAQMCLDKGTFLIRIICCLIIDLLALMFFVKMNEIIVWGIEIYQNKTLILNLSKNDFKTKFAGSYLGMVWAFVQPIVTVLVYWFVFQVGMKAGNTNNFPFVLWLMAGLVPWFFFSDAINGGTNALLEYNYLVKKVVFKISILPIVKVLSALFINVFFVVFVLVLCWFYGYTPDWHTLQILYYIISLFVFVLGLVYLTSSLVVFFRDLTQIISIILQIGVWLTPIMWDASATLSPTLQMVLRLNPMYYIVDGFRDALLAKVWVTDKLIWTIYFWVVTLLIFVLGKTMFRKLQAHFADVL